METTHRLLNGEGVRIDVPGAAGLPGGTSISVLSLEGAGAMEVTGGREADLGFFLEVTGTDLAREVVLRDGRTLRHGRFHGDPAQGLGWAVALDGGHHLFGHTVPVLDVEELSGFLADVDVQVDALGPVLTPTGRTSWAAHRTHTVAQVVELTGALGADGSGGTGYLLDVRRTKSGRTPQREGAGVQVRGGLLTRSGDAEQHRYGILESADFVSYGLPGSDEAVDSVLTSLSEVVVELAS